ncbi:MAG: right-handed parallel beta-helix repeat-containing protein [Bacteroidales bacterium]|nr:right-handed parallel beta-helix repeat-containing protein [Bacteroidales bacterium]
MRTRRRIYTIVIVFIFSIYTVINAETYYVSINGLDTNPGTIVSPFKSISHAIDVSTAGDIIYVRGDQFLLSQPILISKSGTDGNPFNLLAYQGERPVLDFSQQSTSSSNRGIILSGDYWHIEGFDITGAGDNGMKIEGGNYNIIENCAFYRNRDSGLQLGDGASFNQIINCDSYYNADPPDYGDADGFAVKLDVGEGNSFTGCRAWLNCDDGWDGYLRGADDISTTLENCWAFENGYLEDGTDPGTQANGNGFKMGGSDDKTLKHNMILKNCLAFKNKVKGFDQNNNKGSMTLYNCTGHNNLSANYKISQTLAVGKVFMIKNCVALGDVGDIGSFAIQATNSWLGSFEVNDEDFVSILDNNAYGPRSNDGNLPNIQYMKLVTGSDLVDAGVDVGLWYYGDAPDLGCFELSPTAVFPVFNTGSETEIICYPNPASKSAVLTFATGTAGNVTFDIFHFTGAFAGTLSDFYTSGNEEKVEIGLEQLIPGSYVIRIKLDNRIFGTAKLTVM